MLLRFYHLTVLLVCLSTGADARLGDTLLECEGRYGAAAAVNGKYVVGRDLLAGPEESAVFKVDRFRIDVSWDVPEGGYGGADAIRLTGLFTQDQSDAFLAANGGGKPWDAAEPTWAKAIIDEVPGLRLLRQYMRWTSDGKRASFSLGTSIVIESPQAVRLALQKELRKHRNSIKIPNF